MNHTPEQITKLAPEEIFVFGSNSAGRHIAGAALFAKENFGAEEGIGEGVTGQCYAFPTLDRNLKKRNDEQLYNSVARFLKYAQAHHETENAKERPTL